MSGVITYRFEQAGRTVAVRVPSQGVAVVSITRVGGYPTQKQFEITEAQTEALFEHQASIQSIDADEGGPILIGWGEDDGVLETRAYHAASIEAFLEPFYAFVQTNAEVDLHPEAMPQTPVEAKQVNEASWPVLLVGSVAMIIVQWLSMGFGLLFAQIVLPDVMKKHVIAWWIAVGVLAFFASYLLGILIGAIAANRDGRKHAAICGLASLGLHGLLLSFATGWWPMGIVAIPAVFAAGLGGATGQMQRQDLMAVETLPETS